MYNDVSVGSDTVGLFSMLKVCVYSKKISVEEAKPEGGDSPCPSIQLLNSNICIFRDSTLFLPSSSFILMLCSNFINSRRFSHSNLGPLLAICLFYSLSMEAHGRAGGDALPDLGFQCLHMAERSQIGETTKYNLLKIRFNNVRTVIGLLVFLLIQLHKIKRAP